MHNVQARHCLQTQQACKTIAHPTASTTCTEHQGSATNAPATQEIPRDAHALATFLHKDTNSMVHIQVA